MTDGAEKDLAIFSTMIKDVMRLHVPAHNSFRVGKRRQSKPRLLIVTLGSPALKYDVLRGAPQLRHSELYSNIYITPDLTQKEREAGRKLREELAARRKAGESDLAIRSGRIVQVSTMGGAGNARHVGDGASGAGNGAGGAGNGAGGAGNGAGGAGNGAGGTGNGAGRADSGTGRAGNGAGSGTGTGGVGNDAGGAGSLAQPSSTGEVPDGSAAIRSATQQHHQPAPARAAKNGDLSPADLDNGTGELGMQPPAGGRVDQNHVPSHNRYQWCSTRESGPTGNQGDVTGEELVYYLPQEPQHPIH